MSGLLERLEVSALDGMRPAWLVRLDGAPLLHLTENHVAVNDLRATHQFRWGFALLRSPWTGPPELRARDDVVDLFGGDERVGILRWNHARPAHVDVTLFDLDHRLLDAEVRYRQLPATGVLQVPSAPLAL
jgi:hypothetical protein